MENYNNLPSELSEGFELSVIKNQATPESHISLAFTLKGS